jgi:protein-disulfide isomerase
MSKRQEIKARRRRDQIRSRLFTVLLVTVGALLVASAFIIPLIRKAQPVDVGTINPITPRTFTAPVNGRSIGDPEATVRVDIYEDFQCPSCKIYSESTEPLIIADYVETGKVIYTYHIYPVVENFVANGTESTRSANAALCAEEQGRFWDYHDILFANQNGENQGGFADIRLVAFAETLGLDMDTFNSCFDAQEYQDEVLSDIASAQALGVSGTPTLFVNDVLVVNSQDAQYLPTYQDIVNTIDAALAGGE